MPNLAPITLSTHQYGDGQVSAGPISGLAAGSLPFHAAHLVSRATTAAQDATQAPRGGGGGGVAAAAAVTTANMGLGSTNFDSTSILARSQKQTIQYVTISLASVSFLCCLISLYWFVMMRRNFRRTLIMLLLFADLSRSLWLLVFPAVSLTVGGVKTGSPFCDASGFFLQTSLESCDIAILLMSLHMSLQVFNTKSVRLGPDGLYRLRHAVYVLWMILPAFMAALAFVRTGRGSYMSQGAFCTLAIRPFWYRLALSWVPRYLIWLYVTITAVRIYLHVGSGFTVFARQVESGSAGSDNRPSTFDHDTKDPVMPKLRRASAHLFDNVQSPFAHKSPSSDTTHDNSEADDKSAIPSPTKIDDTASHSGPSPPFGLHFQSVSADADRARQDSNYTNASSHVLDYGAAVIIRDGGTSHDPLVNIMPTADITAASRRRAIQRQTRLLFIYPCVYMILMIMPFVQHCFNYSDYYAQRPVFAISILSPACYAIMGTADCTIFCWRERPWKVIPGSDGTFLGSFLFWRFSGPWADKSPALGSAAFEKAAHQYRSGNNRHGSVVDPAIFRPSPASRFASDMAHTYGHGRRASVAGHIAQTMKQVRPQTRRVFSGRSDQAGLAAERAAERLALERAAHTTRMSYLGPQAASGDHPAKEWFDREEELINDDPELYEEEEEEDEEGVAPDQHTARQPGTTTSPGRRIGDGELSLEHERRMRDFGAI